MTFMPTITNKHCFLQRCIKNLRKMSKNLEDTSNRTTFLPAQDLSGGFGRFDPQAHTQDPPVETVTEQAEGHKVCLYDVKKLF